MTVASTLASIAKLAATSGTSAIKIIEAAGAVVTAANLLMEQAKPLVGDVDTKAIVDGIKTGAGSVAKSASDAASGVAEGASSKVSTLFDKLGDAKDELVESLSQAKSEKDLKKDIREARQSVLENATITITISDLAKAKGKAGGTAVGPINNMPACFVIATYKKLDFDKDLTDYIGLYIGKAESAAEGVDRAISREGDPDVYADVKYRQNVHAYVYNCMPEELDGLFENLSNIFSDAQSAAGLQSD